MSTSGTISKMDRKRKQNALEQHVEDDAVVQQIREEIQVDTPNFEMNQKQKVTKLDLVYGHPSQWEFVAERVFGLVGKLDRLERLSLWDCTSVRVCETILRLPNLKDLAIGSCNKLCLRLPKKPLSASAPSHLERLRLSGNVFTESDLEYFLFEVLPLVPKLSHFSTSWNYISSFQRIAQRLRNNGARKRKWGPDREHIHTITSSEMSSTSFPTARLRALDLGEYADPRVSDGVMNDQLYQAKWGEHILGKEEFWDEEVGAINTMLFAYPELQTFKRSGRHCLSYPPFYRRILYSSYITEINYAGRVLVERKSTGNPKTLPLSIWPLVLERAWRWYQRNDYSYLSRPSPNGIYYLLQNVPALQSVNQRKPKPNC